MESVAEAPEFALSLTSKEAESGPPVAVGVPETMPVKLSDRPAGKEPDVIVQAKGAMPRFPRGTMDKPRYECRRATNLW